MTTELQAAAAEIEQNTHPTPPAPSSDDADKALARASRNIGWLEALPPYGDTDTRKAAADDMCRALEELRAHIAAQRNEVEQMAEKIAKLEADNKRLREALEFYADGKHYKLGNICCEFGDVAEQSLAQSDGKEGE